MYSICKYTGAYAHVEDAHDRDPHVRVLGGNKHSKRVSYLKAMKIIKPFQKLTV